MSTWLINERHDRDLSATELEARIKREWKLFKPQFLKWQETCGRAFEESYESYCRARGFEPVEPFIASGEADQSPTSTDCTPRGHPKL